MSSEIRDAVAHIERDENLAALEILQPEAEAGNADAQCLLGWMYEVGRGVGKDVEVAAELYRSSAAAGSAVAEFYLGRLCQSGGDSDRALEWYTQSAQHGFGPAFYRLAHLARRQGEPIAVVRELFSKGSALGHIPSELEALRMAFRGRTGLARIQVLPRSIRILARFIRIAAQDMSDPRVLL